jgi:hypothetical protein
MPAPRHHDGMTSPQLSVRSARARDLAHELSRREGRPIHAIVEEALTEYAKRHPKTSAADFLRRLQSLAVEEVDLTLLVAENRSPHPGIDL